MELPDNVKPRRIGDRESAYNQDEDCLSFNIWCVPARPDEKRPVMVWFHGGGFAVGSASLPIFDGANLTKRGVIVVTANHRLVVLGFLAHPDLSAEVAGWRSGTLGFLLNNHLCDRARDNIATVCGLQIA